MGLAHLQHPLGDPFGKGRAKLLGGHREGHRQQLRLFPPVQRRAAPGLVAQADGGFEGLRVHAQLAEERMVRAVHAEDLAQQVHHLDREVQQIAFQPQRGEERHEVFLLFQRRGGDGGVGRGEDQVLHHRQRGVVALGVEEMHLIAEPCRRDARGDLAPQRHQRRRQRGMRRRIEALLDAACEKSAVDLHALDQLQPPGPQRGLVRPGASFRVDPGHVQRIDAVARPFALEGPRALARPARLQPERQRDVFAKTAEEHHRARGRVAHAPCDRPLMQARQRLPRHRDAARRRQQFTRQHFGKRAAILVAGGGDGDGAGGRQGDGDILQHHVPIRVLHAHPVQHHLPVQRRYLPRLRLEERAVDHARRREAFGDRLPAQRHVRTLVVIGEQFLPGAGEVLVGRQRRHQRAHGHIAPDRQIAADGIEEEGRQLSDEVVEKLHEELLLEDLETDFE